MEKKAIIKKFSDFVKIQSVSTDPNRFSEIKKAVDWLSFWLKKMGFKIRLIEKPKAPPLIIATLVRPHSSCMVGIYGHYDVQPEDPIAEWRTSPFELTLRNGKFFGRGAADNKGHIIQNFTTINQLIVVEKLKNNIVFILEGEEETGSCHFEEYISQAKEILSKVDVFYITDVGMHKRNQPQIFYGLRGLIYFELKIKIGERDLHSGIYGNRVLNPAQVLADLLAKIKDLKTNKIKIPHFYDRCRKITTSEIEMLQPTLRSLEEERKNAGVYKIVKFGNIHPTLASKIYPSFEVNGVSSGFTGEGQKTIIPKEVMVKFSSRLVEHQNPDEIKKLVFDFVANNLPDGIKYELKCLSKSSPFYTNIDNEYVKKTAKVLKEAFGNEALFNRSGGSIPAAEILQRLFKKPIILTGFTLPDDNLHAPNENFDEEMFFKGIGALEKIYRV